MSIPNGKAAAPDRTPASRAALHAKARALSTAGDLESLARLLASVPPAALPPALVSALSAVALELRDPSVIEASVAASMRAPLAPRMRALMAWRLAFAGHAAQAWAVLQCDPAVVAAEEARAVVQQLLGRIAATEAAESELRLAARGLLARLAIVPAEVPLHPAPYVYSAGETGPRAGATPVETAAAPGIRPETRAAFAARLDAFEAMLAARRARPTVRAYHDVFVNAVGQVWKPDGQLLHGTERPLSAASHAGMAAAPRIAAAVYAVEQFDNMFHWVADVLPSIAWRFAPGAPDLPLVLQAGAAPFKLESLAVLAGGAAPAIAATTTALFVGRLYTGTFGSGSLAPEGPHRDLIETVAAAADAAPEPPDGLPGRLYISRRDAAKRRMGNEAALEKALVTRGFGIRLFSGRGFLEQVRLVRGARVIVAPHGAALGLLMFARPGTAVFEVVPAMTRAAGLRCCMARVSRLCGMRHRMWLEPENPVSGAWTASLAPLLDDLDAWVR